MFHLTVSLQAAVSPVMLSSVTSKHLTETKARVVCFPRSSLTDQLGTLLWWVYPLPRIGCLLFISSGGLWRLVSHLGCTSDLSCVSLPMHSPACSWTTNNMGSSESGLALCFAPWRCRWVRGSWEESEWADNMLLAQTGVIISQR